MIPKLRAWSKTEGKFLKDDDLNFVIHPYDRTVYHAESYPTYPDNEWAWRMDEDPTDDLEIDRDTESHDVKNCPIFENDLLLCTYHLNGETAIGIVKMIDGCWSVDFRYLPPRKRPYDPVYKIRRDFDYLKMFGKAAHNKREVVGNIYKGIKGE
jgi:hypothetical protein